MRDRRPLAVVVLAAVLASPSLGAYQSRPAEPASEAPLNDADLGARVDQAILRHGLGQFWGGVLVAKDGKAVLAKGYGLANDELRPIDADTLFDIGSVAKQFTAAAVLRLEQAGKLSTADPVSKYYPDLPEIASKVTLAHLLSHTSGMNDEVAIQGLGFPDRDEAVRLAMTSRFKGAPGAGFDYCNAGYIVLAAIIEKATGKKYEQVVREELFVPAGMKSSGFLDGEGLDPARQTARVIEGRGPKPIRTTLFAGGVEPWAWGLRGAGGALTTLNDLVKWERALAGDTVLTAESKKKLWTPGLSNYGMGWFIETTARGTRRVQHTGGTRGFVSLLEIFPDEGLVIAVLTNTSGNPFEIEKLVSEQVFPGESSAVAAKLLLSKLTLSQYRACDAEEGVSFGVTHGVEGKARRTTLTVKIGENAAAEIAMSPGVAKKLASQIAGFAAGRPKGVSRGTSVRDVPGASPGSTPSGNPPAGGPQEAAAGIPTHPGLVIATLPYTPVEGVVTLPSTVEWTVMPEYHGGDEQGNTYVDKRITVVLIDEEAGFWPLILRLDTATAEKLVEELNGG
jgi:CubicO group peptidase (beta-lactamase class C family)